MISTLAINSWCDYVHRSMPTHNNLLTLAGLPAQVALLTFVNVRKFLVSLLILNRGAPSFSQALTYDSSLPLPWTTTQVPWPIPFSSPVALWKFTVRPPFRGWFSLFSDAVSIFIQNETNLAETKTKALPNSSLYGPYQALSSSNPLLQASFMGIAICKGINGECNFF